MSKTLERKVNIEDTNEKSISDFDLNLPPSVGDLELELLQLQKKAQTLFKQINFTNENQQAELDRLEQFMASAGMLNSQLELLRSFTVQQPNPQSITRITEVDQTLNGIMASAENMRTVIKHMQTIRETTEEASKKIKHSSFLKAVEDLSQEAKQSFAAKPVIQKGLRHEYDNLLNYLNTIELNIKSTVTEKLGYSDEFSDCIEELEQIYSHIETQLTAEQREFYQTFIKSTLDKVRTDIEETTKDILASQHTSDQKHKSKSPIHTRTEAATESLDFYEYRDRIANGLNKILDREFSDSLTITETKKKFDSIAGEFASLKQSIANIAGKSATVFTRPNAYSKLAQHADKQVDSRVQTLYIQKHFTHLLKSINNFHNSLQAFKKNLDVMSFTASSLTEAYKHFDTFKTFIEYSYNQLKELEQQIQLLPEDSSDKITFQVQAKEIAAKINAMHLEIDLTQDLLAIAKEITEFKQINATAKEHSRDIKIIEHEKLAEHTRLSNLKPVKLLNMPSSLKAIQQEFNSRTQIAENAEIVTSPIQAFCASYQKESENYEKLLSEENLTRIKTLTGSTEITRQLTDLKERTDKLVRSLKTGVARVNKNQVSDLIELLVKHKNDLREDQQAIITKFVYRNASKEHKEKMHEEFAAPKEYFFDDKPLPERYQDYLKQYAPTYQIMFGEQFKLLEKYTKSAPTDLASARASSAANAALATSANQEAKSGGFLSSIKTKLINGLKAFKSAMPNNLFAQPQSKCTSRRHEEYLSPRAYKRYMANEGLLKPEKPREKLSERAVDYLKDGFDISATTLMPGLGNYLINPNHEENLSFRFFGKKKTEWQEKLKQTWFRDLRLELNLLDSYLLLANQTISKLLYDWTHIEENEFFATALPVLDALNQLQDLIKEQEYLIKVMMHELTQGEVAKKLGGTYNQEFNQVFADYIQQGLIKGMEVTATQQKSMSQQTLTKVENEDNTASTQQHQYYDAASPVSEPKLEIAEGLGTTYRA